MKIIEIIHGYPPQYNAGSENYTESVVRELVSRGNRVTIFCREENSFRPEFEVKVEKLSDELTKYTINVVRTKDRFFVNEIDRVVEEVTETVEPEVAHIEHLNHLSLGIPGVLKENRVPMAYTIHDYWLMCPRGQFIQFNTEGEQWNNCDGQEDSKCASICYGRYHSGVEKTNVDLEYWTGWVSARMNGVRKVVDEIDYFLAPSRTVLETFLKYFPNASKKTGYLDYGFNLNKLRGRKRIKEDKFVFGYVGTHIPAKGIDYLIRAFGRLRGSSILRIWGRRRGEYTPYLVQLGQSVSKINGSKIEWMGEFDSERIIEQVFNKVDAIVVPSIWLENSPLVIHEAQQARVPVITADVGGMAEYVKDGQNGLLFKFRDVDSIVEQMQSMLSDPMRAMQLGESGYKFSKSGDVQSIEFHVDELMRVFKGLTTNTP